MSGSLFRVLEAFSTRRIRATQTLTSPNSWASRALWNQSLSDTDEAREGDERHEDSAAENEDGRDVYEQRNHNNGNNLDATKREKGWHSFYSLYEQQLGKNTTNDPIRNAENTRIRREFVQDMRMRNQGGVLWNNNCNTPTTPTQPLTHANLSVPSSLGSQDYIYLAQ